MEADIVYQNGVRRRQRTEGRGEEDLPYLRIPNTPTHLLTPRASVLHHRQMKDPDPKLLFLSPQSSHLVTGLRHPERQGHLRRGTHSSRAVYSGSCRSCLFGWGSWFHSYNHQAQEWERELGRPTRCHAPQLCYFETEYLRGTRELDSKRNGLFQNPKEKIKIWSQATALWGEQIIKSVFLHS